MKSATPTVAATGSEAAAAAAMASISGGGGAVDAVVAAALAWPSGLMAAGSLCATGPGLGRFACRFPARVPGLGLSRPRRSKLLGDREVAGTVATPSTVPTLASVLARWGVRSFLQAVRAARSIAPDHEVPHDAALEMLEAGPAAAVKGAFGQEAARLYGPVAGGLLTRRDLIEARADEAELAGEDSEWVSTALDATRPREPLSRVLAVVVADRAGSLAALALEAGPHLNGLPSGGGALPNTLLRCWPGVGPKKVGRLLPLRSGTAIHEGEGIVLAGRSDLVRSALDEDVDGDVEGGLVVLRAHRSPASRALGAEHVLSS